MRIRSYLVALIVSIFVPFTIFAGVIAHRLLEDERNAYVDGLRSTARALAIAIDRNIADVSNSLKVLAAAELLRISAFEGFHRYADRVVRARPELDRLMLVRPDGSIVFSTDASYGTDFDYQIRDGGLDQAIATGRAVIGSIVATAGGTGPTAITVFVPAVVEDGGRYALIAYLKLSVIGAIFSDQRLRPDWTGVVVDTNATILGRSRSADAFVGQPAPAALGTAIADSAEGIARYATQEGLATLAGFARSSATGWTVVLGMPVNSVDPTAGRTLYIVIATGLAIGLLALALAAFLGRQISRSVLGLLEPALAMARGEPIKSAAKSRIAEIQLVTSKLIVASGILAERERQRQQAEDHLARAQRVAAIGSWELSLAAGKIHWSDETYRIFGVARDAFEPTLGGLEAFVLEEDLGRVREPIRRAKAGHAPEPSAISVDYRIRRQDGAIRMLRREGEPVFGAAGNLVALIGTVQDVTDARAAEARRRELEQKLQQTQKMEALGQLTGGIAHDFNNLLAVILGNLEIAVDRQRRGKFATEIDEASLRAVIQGTALTRQLLAFARRQPLRPVCQDLRQLVHEMLPILEQALTLKIALALETPDAPCWAEIDSGQFEAALLNLVINARDAMPDGGTVTIILQNSTESPFSRTDGPDCVTVIVKDTGTGMTSDVMAHAFEPFFTTKGIGKGSGLGLSMVYGFVRQSGGRVELDSRLGSGTAVKLHFRRSAAPAPAVRGEKAPSIPPQRLRILLVEDEPDVRETVRTMLSDIGATVVTAPDGVAALAILAEDHAIDAILTDIVMRGGIDGIALAERATAIRPGVRTAFMSGYAEFDERTLHVINKRPFLAKPFQKLELATALESL